MKYIECPECLEEIPEDSRYCDMCGVELLECVKCHSIGSEPFCSECGSPMISRSKNSRKTNDPTVTSRLSTPTNNEEEQTTIGKTIGGRAKTVTLKAREGRLTIIPEDGAIIGRTEGKYCNLLSGHDLISRKHAKFQKRGRDWYLLDLGSTNGCFINDIELKPNVPMKFAAGDVVDIGTYIFDVV